MPHTITSESELYPPVKSFLQSQGYTVKGEIGDCDVVAVRGDEDPLIVELKKSITLDLLFQGIDRQQITDKVYLAVPHLGPMIQRYRKRNRYRDIIRLCRLLGLGLLSVHFARSGVPWVEPHLDPLPYRPRKNRKRKEMLLKEFALLAGDPNPGGAASRPRVTPYRQDVLLCAHLLHVNGPLKVSHIREMSGVSRTASILQKDFYGWFQRVVRGVYDLSPNGKRAIEAYADTLEAILGRQTRTTDTDE